MINGYKQNQEESKHENFVDHFSSRVSSEDKLNRSEPIKNDIHYSLQMRKERNKFDLIQSASANP